MLDELKKTFDFGAWADSRTDEVLEYGGKQIRKHPDGRITLTQEKFIRAATLSPLPKWRLATPNSELLGKEMTELRSAGGCLHWLVGQTRPDLAAGTSLFMSGKPTVHHLTQLNRLLKEAKNSETWGLTFRPIDLEKAKVVVFSDSSWANTEELKSQAGFMVVLAGGAVDADWRYSEPRRLEIPQDQTTMPLNAGSRNYGDGCSNGCWYLLQRVSKQEAHQGVHPFAVWATDYLANYFQ